MIIIDETDVEDGEPTRSGRYGWSVGCCCGLADDSSSGVKFSSDACGIDASISLTIGRDETWS
jgi:hypothetical protein